MPKRLVRQPNGLFAVFSTVVDRFTIVDMDEGEALQWAREIGLSDDDARDKLDAAKADTVWEAPPDVLDGLCRWRNDLGTVFAIHGEEVARQVEAMCSLPADGSEAKNRAAEAAGFTIPFGASQ